MLLLKASVSCVKDVGDVGRMRRGACRKRIWSCHLTFRYGLLGFISWFELVGDELQRVLYLVRIIHGVIEFRGVECFGIPESEIFLWSDGAIDVQERHQQIVCTPYILLNLGHFNSFLRLFLKNSWIETFFCFFL